jgi:predicted O-methyltransferase YrrM
MKSRRSTMADIVRNLWGMQNVRGAKEMLRDLRSEEHESAQFLANALDTFFLQSICPDEERYVRRIESLRKELAASHEHISVVDYGAGPFPVPVSPEEKVEGRTVTRTLDRICKAAIPPVWGLLLLKLGRAFKPSASLELGTSLGISAAYHAAALDLNGTGRMLTLEGAKSLADKAGKNLVQLGLQRVAVKDGPFKATLGMALQELQQIDYAFIDGHHEEQATLKYFEQILPFVGDPAVFVFDDISWSEGMARAWNTITSNSRVKIVVDLSKLGICVITSSLDRKLSYRCTPSFWQKALVYAEVAVGI